MVINNFYIERIAISPDEADPILVINANAVLAFTITLQSLKTIFLERLSNLAARELHAIVRVTLRDS